jgi:hypothetical protein
VVDITTLGAAAFDHAAEGGVTLRTLLQVRSEPPARTLLSPG